MRKDRFSPLRTSCSTRRWQWHCHYNVRGYPTTLFLDANGVLQDMHFGEIAREGPNASINKLKQ